MMMKRHFHKKETHQYFPPFQYCYHGEGSMYYLTVNTRLHPS